MKTLVLALLMCALSAFGQAVGGGGGVPGAPGSSVPSGPAGGALAGTYPNPTLVSPISAKSATSSATLGSELTTNGTFSGSLTGWTDSGSNWSYSSGALHTAGAADTLSQTITVTSGQTYQITFTLSGVTAGSVAIAIGGVPIYLDGSQTAFAASLTYNRSFVAGASGSLVFTPTSAFAGTVTGVSVKQVTLASVTPALEALNSDGSLGVPIYSGGISGDNVFIGQLAGTSNTVGFENVGIGWDALSGNITGYGDVAAGYNAMLSNTVGYQDTAMGAGAMQANTSGSGNSAFGFFALTDNTLGFDNQAFGEFALWNNTTGQDNSAFGQAASQDNTTGNNNTAVGVGALEDNSTSNNNTALGFEALLTTTAASNTAVGANSLLLDSTGANNTAVGQSAAEHDTTGGNQVAIGQGALFNETTGNQNVAVGQGALLTQNGAANNVAVGASALFGDTTGGSNTALGYEAGYPSIGDANTTGTNNTWIGYQAGPGTATQLNNSTCLGNGCANSASNQVVLGNAAVTQTVINESLVLNGSSSGSATLSVSSTGGTLTLPNATQATTQTVGDTSLDVATDAFVLANVNSGAVTSFNARAGAVVPTTGDYTAAQVTNAVATNVANTFTAAQTAPAFNLQSKAAGPYSTFFDDFYTQANIGHLAIGSASGNLCGENQTYLDLNHPGNILITSGTGGTGTGDVCSVYGPQLGQIASANSSSLGWTWETAVYVPVLPGTTVGAYQAGLTHTLQANPWTTGVGFYLSSANGVANDWYCEYASTYTDTTVAATVAWQRLTIVSDATKVHWYIGGTEVCGTGVAVASMPSTIQQPAWSSTALSGTSVTMAVDYVDFQRAVSR